MLKAGKPLVESIPERCRVCYTCVRECPAKAIRIEHGQAQVVPERCIGCGNCVRVCSQNAKKVYNSIGQVEELLEKGEKCSAIIAPSFPVEFTEISYKELVGMLKKLGFSHVNEVAFGADLVAKAYKELLDNNKDEQFIATTCPAMVLYVEYYFPDLVNKLAPIVSPMVATARALRKIHGEDLNVVFIGPCIAKKNETEQPEMSGEIEEVLTFSELRELFAKNKITSKNTEEADFDPPSAQKGMLFPVARGLLEAADIKEDLITGDVIATDGKENFIESIKEFDRGVLKTKLLEVICCQGCIMGAGITKKEMPLFQRRAAIGKHVRKRMDDVKEKVDLNDFNDLDLSRVYTVKDKRIPLPTTRKITDILSKMGKFTLEDELNCGACGYVTCREHAVAILKGLAESEMCLPYTIDKLKVTVQQLADSNEEVTSIQNALMQSEKLASMGQLAAGVAHEVNNPLGIVLMYAHLLLENEDINGSLKDDLGIIATQADRCKRIISGLLNFARQNKTVLQSSNMMDLITETIKTVNLSKTIKVVIIDTLNDPIAEIDRDQIAQCLLNLFTNAEAAMVRGGTLTISLSDTADMVTITITDTGIGISEENLAKIFDPFFTTKQIGKGTGLGLAVLFGIIKMHRGNVKVTSNIDESNGKTGTTFTIKLPRKEI